MAYVAPGYSSRISTNPALDSTTASGSVTNPGAGAAICTLSAPAAGQYRIDVVTCYGVGAVAAAENLNMQLKVGATAFAAMPVSATATSAVGGSPLTCTYFLTLSGVDALTVNAVGASTATAIYTASIIATRIA